MWQYRKVYARWCMPSPRAPTTAPDAPPLHLYSTSDPADSVPTSPMTPPNPHFRIQPSFYLPPPNPPLPYLSPPNLPSPYLPPPSPPSPSIPPSPSPPSKPLPPTRLPPPTPPPPAPDFTPSDADTDHSDDAEF